VGSEEEGTPRRRTHARGGDDCVRLDSSRGRRKPSGTHAAVSGEGGGGLGRLEAKAQWGGRPATRPGRRRRPMGGGGEWAWKEGEVGPREGRWGAGQPKAKAQAQVTGSKIGDGPKLKKKFFSNFNYFRIWQNFEKLHKEI
jgi:hypothetical protein